MEGGVGSEVGMMGKLVGMWMVVVIGYLMKCFQKDEVARKTQRLRCMNYQMSSWTAPTGTYRTSYANHHTIVDHAAFIKGVDLSSTYIFYDWGHYF